MHATFALAYARSQSARFVAELSEFVRFPSVSAQPQHAADVRNCAGWLAGHLHKVGLEHIQVAATAGHPVVYADWGRAADRPTLIVYGHYDVHPADPVSEWTSPPFAAVVRDDDLFGRGAADDKGQMFAHVKAIESLLSTTRTLPVNVKCVFEGEEEIGSPNLAAFLQRHAAAFKADVAVLSDSPMLGPDRPVITESLRGGLSVELEVAGPGHDLHSGNFGGAVHNPLQALCEILAGLHDRAGRVTIAGFYDRVRAVDETERAYMRKVGPTDTKILADAGARQGWGERGYSLYERTTIRPALTINGISGGYGGRGVKAVIPARASAKLNFRLAPDQDPQEIDALLRRHIARVTPPTVQVTLTTLLSAKPALTDRHHPAVRAAAEAYRQGFGAAPVFLRCGGTIPVADLLKETLGIATVLMGFALPDDRLHAPNEKFHLPNFHKGIATSIAFQHEIARIGSAALRQAAPPKPRDEVAA